MEYTWPELAEKLKRTITTSETLKEYLNFEKPLQAERKDVGGFVGGTIAGGRRLKDSITARSLITLDIDFADMEFWEDFQQFYDQAAFIYGTHKHYPQHPRFRLIMPLAREVQADEYEAIARRLASNMDIEVFDRTTFEPARLMYWPSTPRDQVYYWKQQEGDFLDPDKVLATYKDWKDQSQWAYHASVDKEAREGIKKQAEPTEKRGLVGAFCREYTITEAIREFLPDVYEETEHAERFTFLAGSTYGGLVVYEDKWAYSHHGTDPCSEKLCNAFDLVRIHKYGQFDENVKEKTNATKYPSYIAMTNFCMAIPAVNLDNIRQRIDQVRELFNEVELLDPAEDTSWMQGLQGDKTGQLLNTINNIVLILRNDPQMKGAICWDEMAQRVWLRRNLPWRKIKNKPEFGEKDDASMRLWLEAKYNLTAVAKINDAIMIISQENGFHPVKDYLGTIGEWDKVDRLDKLLIDYMGAEDSVYTREVTRKAFVAAVARIYEPGIKYDYVLTMLGKQGMGKSTLIAKMGGDWYSENLGDITKNSGMEQIQGVWLQEIPELAGFKKVDIEHVKGFVSRQVDRFRVAYGKRVEAFARQCIFFGTSNEDTPLQDMTGGRRFWIVKLKAGRAVLNVWDITPDDVKKLWAEACWYYTMGEDLFLTPEVEKMAEEIQALATEEDFRKGAVLEFLEMKVPGNWEDLPISERINFINTGDVDMFGEKPTELFERERVTVPEVWCEKFRKNLADMTNVHTKFIRNIMRQQTSWEDRVIKTKLYGLQRGWVKKGHFV